MARELRRHTCAGLDHASPPPLPGAISVDPSQRYLYLVQDGGRALRYGVGVGREGFGWSGTATIHDKQEWPDWYPPKEMIQRQPELRKALSQLQSGLGMHGSKENMILSLAEIQRVLRRGGRSLIQMPNRRASRSLLVLAHPGIYGGLRVRRSLLLHR